MSVAITRQKQKKKETIFYDLNPSTERLVKTQLFIKLWWILKCYNFALNLFEFVCEQLFIIFISCIFDRFYNYASRDFFLVNSTSSEYQRVCVRCYTLLREITLAEKCQQTQLFSLLLNEMQSQRFQKCILNPISTKTYHFFKGCSKYLG